MTEQPNTFRLDLIPEFSIEETEAKIQSFLDELGSEKYAIAYELSDKRKKWHWQGIIWYAKSNQNYRKIGEKHLSEWTATRGCGKDGLRSFAPVNKSVEGYSIYISKSANWKFVKGYSENDLKTMHDSYTPPGKQAGGSVDRKKPESNFQAAYNYVFEHYLSKVNGMIDPLEVGASIIDYYQSKVKCESNNFQEENMTKSIIRHYYFQNYPDRYKRWRMYRAQEVIGNRFHYPDIGLVNSYCTGVKRELTDSDQFDFLDSPELKCCTVV